MCAISITMVELKAPSSRSDTILVGSFLGELRRTSFPFSYLENFGKGTMGLGVELQWRTGGSEEHRRVLRLSDKDRIENRTIVVF